MDCLKLGISTGLYGLTLTNLLNDVLLGQPEVRMAPVGMNVINPEYINIMITSHQHTILLIFRKSWYLRRQLQKQRQQELKALSWLDAHVYDKIFS